MGTLMVRPKSQVTDIWCKRIDRALGKLKDNNLLVSVKQTTDSLRATIIRYDLSEACRATASVGTYTKSRIVPSGDGWAVPINYGTLCGNNIGVQWLLSLTVSYMKPVRCVYIRDTFNTVDAGIQMRDTNTVLDSFIERMLGSISRYTEYLTPSDVTLTRAESPDALPSILTVPSIDCDRTLMALKDHIGLAVPVNHFIN